MRPSVCLKLRNVRVWHDHGVFVKETLAYGRQIPVEIRISVAVLVPETAKDFASVDGPFKIWGLRLD